MLKVAERLCELLRRGSKTPTYRFIYAIEPVPTFVEGAIRELSSSYLAGRARVRFPQETEETAATDDSLWCLSAPQLSALIEELSSEDQICAADRRSFCEILMQALGTAFQHHIVCVGVRINRRLQPYIDRDHVQTEELATAEEAESKFSEIVESWREWRPGAVQGRVGDLWVTPSTTWARFFVQLAEHFEPDRLPHH